MTGMFAEFNRYLMQLRVGTITDNLPHDLIRRFIHELDSTNQGRILAKALAVDANAAGLDPNLEIPTAACHLQKAYRTGSRTPCSAGH